MTHICVSKLVIIGSDNGLSPGRRQAIICTNAGILLIGPLGTNFSEILIEIHTFSFKKMPFKLSSGKWRPFCLGLNVLRDESITQCHWLHPALALDSFHKSGAERGTLYEFCVSFSWDTNWHITAFTMVNLFGAHSSYYSCLKFTKKNLSCTFPREISQVFLCLIQFQCDLICRYHGLDGVALSVINVKGGW